MKKHLLWVLLSFPFIIHAQARIVQLQSYKTLDSIRSNSHITIEKLPEDSAWLVHQYDAHDSIMVIGTYKDEKVTIPNGRFKYYTYDANRLEITYNYTLHKADTVFKRGKNRLSKTGHYVNGQKEGVWATFDNFGKIGTETYEHGILNGAVDFYNSNTGKAFLAGNYINGVREGSWYSLSFEGDTIGTQIYKKGKIVKTISESSGKKFKEQQVIGAKPSYDFIRYLNSQLAKKGVSRSGSIRTRYFFSIDTAGHIFSPSLLPADGSNAQDNLEVDTTIIDVMLNAPSWLPAYQNKKKVLVRQSIALDIVFNGKRINVSTTTEKDKEDVERFIYLHTDPEVRDRQMRAPR